MSLILPINVDDLLLARSVESARIEFKAAWDPAVEGPQVLKTICAFANDIQNLNGGYVVLGVAESDGVAILPPVGLAETALDGIQRWIRGQCNRMDPPYQPVLSPEVIEGRHVLVVWAPASDARPHKSPGPPRDRAGSHYYVRLGSESVMARDEILTQLMQQTARVPFDDRRASGVPIEALRESRVREFLRDIRSQLVAENDLRDVLRRMRVSAPANGHDVPRNVGLMFFADDPEEWFRGARVEIVQYAADAGGDLLEERVFRGPLHSQLREAIAYLRTLSIQHLQKIGDRPQVKGWTSYPLPAFEESLVNAVYHRSYEASAEPIKVYLFPDRMEIISYPGPVRGIEAEHLCPGGHVPPVPARNRRIGEFLKELRLAEGRGTGLPKVFRAMEQNGSPPPLFDFDPDRSYFRVTLPAHPEYRAIAALRDAAQLRAVGDTAGSLERLKGAFKDSPATGVVATALIEEYRRLGDLAAAQAVFDALVKGGSLTPTLTRAARELASAYLDAGLNDDARRVLDQVQPAFASGEAADLAIVERRAGREQRAHAYFEQAGEAALSDARWLHEFAQSKMRLAEEIYRRPGRSHADDQARKRLLRDAHDMLKRVTQLDAPASRHAWAWFNLGETLRRLRAPRQQIVAALEQAVQLDPHEGRFKRKLAQEITSRR